MRQDHGRIKCFLEENALVLTYRGMLFSELMFRLLDVLESEMEHSGVSLNRVKKVFMAGVECMQNILEHAPNADRSSVVLSFGNNGKEIYFTTGNYIEASQKQYLEILLKELSDMNKLELRDLYKQKMGEVHPKENKGGLGLIYLMKMKDVNIDYTIIEENNKFWFEINLTL